MNIDSAVKAATPTAKSLFNRVFLLVSFGCLGLIVLAISSAIHPLIFWLFLCYPVGRCFWALINGRGALSWFRRKAGDKDTLHLFANK